MNNEYYTLEKNTVQNEELVGIYEEKKSKFYSYIFNVKDQTECNEKINKIREENKDARHIVYIYSLLNDGNKIIRFSDDGEPQGTGTRAIYDSLEKENLTNICIVIVRYFGGILLGAGPLSRAYFKAYKEAYNKAKKIKIYTFCNSTYTLSYSSYDKLKPVLNKYVEEGKIKVLNIDYTGDITLNLSIREDILIKIQEIIQKYM